MLIETPLATGLNIKVIHRQRTRIQNTLIHTHTASQIKTLAQSYESYCGCQQSMGLTAPSWL